MDMGPAAKDAVPDLVVFLQTADPGTGQILDLEYDIEIVRSWGVIDKCVEALGTIGPDASEAVPILTEFLSTRRVELQRVAVTALGKIGGDASSALPTLKDLEKNSPNETVRTLSQEAIDKIEGEEGNQGEVDA